MGQTSTDRPHRLKVMEIDQSVVDAIEEVVKARGWCVAGYSQVEFILADFVVKVGQIPEYGALAAPFPMNFSTRLARVRSIAEKAGPMSRFSSGLASLTDAIEGWEQLRHFLTHGWMDVTVQKPENSITFRFRRWQPTKADKTRVTMITCTLEQLQECGRELSLLADTAIQMFDDIYRAFDLEPDQPT